MKRRTKVAVLSTLAIMAASAATAQNKIELTVTDVPNGNGKILVATDKGQLGEAQAVAGTTVVTVDDVPDGGVMFYVLHDENCNLTCDMDGGLPKECVANDKFNISKDATNLTIKMKNIAELVRRKRAETSGK